MEDNLHYSVMGANSMPVPLPDRNKAEGLTYAWFDSDLNWFRFWRYQYWFLFLSLVETDFSPTHLSTLLVLLRFNVTRLRKNREMTRRRTEYLIVMVLYRKAREMNKFLCTGFTNSHAQEKKEACSWTKTNTCNWKKWRIRVEKISS